MLDTQVCVAVTARVKCPTKGKIRVMAINWAKTPCERRVGSDCDELQGGRLDDAAPRSGRLCSPPSSFEGGILNRS
jgi:hypothetical protein